MADPSIYTYPSPLKGYENLEPLSSRSERNADGKSLLNPPITTRSQAYTSFAQPIGNDDHGGFDVHIYFQQTDEEETKFAQELHERVRREFPELRIYRFFDRPLGPHIIGMFEVNLLTPEQFGAFVPWLVINRGPLSALVHPNTDEGALRDHTQRATWMGQPVPLNTAFLRKFG
ncbi:hypothetical protein MBLNU230_g2865t1 [Neophaeotheca triangularis]